MAVNSKAGFALMVALGLLALLTIILLAASSLITVGIQQSNTELRQWQAQQNALLGLKVGLATLQTEVGPDQRVTARADILGVDVSDIGGEGLADGKRYWVGVWNSPDGPAAPVRRWLVSGSGDQSPEAAWGDAAGQWVVLVGGESDDRDIRVAKELLRDGGRVTGAFAWWADDEGVKANFALDGTSIPNLNSGQFPARLGIEFSGDENSGAYRPEWFRDQSPPVALALLHTLADLSLSDPNSGNGHRRPGYSHDFTAHSFGVQIDVNAGGLRHDLSFGLAQDSIIDPHDSDNFLWHLSLEQGESWPVPSWELLRRWYRLPFDYPQLRGDPNPEMPVLSIGEAGRGEARTAPAVHPLLLYASLTYGVQLVPEDDVYRIWLTIKPVFALWNPWDVTLAATNYTILGPHGGAGTPGILVDLVDQRSIQFTYTNHTNTFGLSNQQERHALRYELNGVSLLPGEVAWFTLPSDVIPYSVAELDGPGPVLVRGMRPETFIALPIIARTPASAFPSDYEDGEDRFLITPEEMEADPDLFLRVRGGSRIWHFFHSPPASPRVKLQRLATQNLRPNSARHALAQIVSHEGVADPIDMVATAQFFVPPNSHDGWQGRTNILRFGNIRARRQNQLGESHLWEFGFHPFGATAPFLGHDSEQGIHFSEDLLWGSDASLASTDTDSILGPVLFHVPREPLFSVGQLQHIDLGATAYDSSYAIGNSYSSPYITPDSTQRVIRSFASNAVRDAIQDYSYLANEALWDRFFFSTMSATEEHDWHVQNPRMVVLNPAADYSGTEQQGPFADTRAYTSASNLLTNGAFNINSTSVKAWRSVLGSLNLSAITSRDPHSGDLREPSELATRSAFPRSPVPISADSGGAQSRQLWHDLPSLSETQIEALAGQIVYRIRERGRPFRSLSEFINRVLQPYQSVYAPDDPALKGLLQRAIDAPNAVTIDSGSNHSETFSYEDDPINPGRNDGSIYGAQTVDFGPGQKSPEQTDWFRQATVALAAEGAPGWLTQADILAALGPFLAARSDTFKIRFHGEVLDSLGLPVAEATGEVVVQRLPGYVDNSQAPFESPAGVNESFGRRLQVVRFRWLEADQE